MLVISRIFFQLLGVCLVLYTSAAFASPVAIDSTSQPQGGLERRRPPSNILCVKPDDWLRRECVPGRSASSWRDVCKNGNGPPTPKDSKCQSGEMCANYIDSDGVLKGRNIICVPELSPAQGPQRATADGPLIGTGDTKVSIPDNEWVVHIQEDLGLCSVTAALLSDDQTSTWAPVTPLNGRVQRNNALACQGDSADTLLKAECYPLKRVNLHKGDFIKFTWGMPNGLTATLQYAIIPQGINA